MWKRLATYAFLFMIVLGMSTASVDVLCLVLWHFENGNVAHEDHSSIPLHHPEAPESHVDGTGHNDPISVLVLSSIIDDAINLTSYLDSPLVPERAHKFERDPLSRDPQIERVDRPPQHLS